RSCVRAALTEPMGTGPADVVIVPGEVPELERPMVHEVRVRDERPVFTLDLIPQLRRQASRRDRAGVPAMRSLLDVEIARVLCGFGEAGTALLEYATPFRRDQFAATFDQRRQRGLGVRGDREIDFVV